MRFLKYLLVGGTATAVHYAVLVAGVEVLHAPAALGAGLGAFVGAIWAYAGNRRYTFSDRAGAHHRALPRFLAVATLMALGHAAIVALGQACGLHYLLAQIAASALALAAGYGLNKRWSFA